VRRFMFKEYRKNSLAIVFPLRFADSFIQIVNDADDMHHGGAFDRV
jgi:hypothetical protein